MGGGEERRVGALGIYGASKKRLRRDNVSNVDSEDQMGENAHVMEVFEAGEGRG